MRQMSDREAYVMNENQAGSDGALVVLCVIFNLNQTKPRIFGSEKTVTKVEVEKLIEDQEKTAQSSISSRTPSKFSTSS